MVNDLVQGLNDTAKWIRSRDPLATNFIYCVQAASALRAAEERERVLKLAAERFREYEGHHRARAECLGDTLERDELDRKADRNREMAELCEAALSPAPEKLNV